MTLGNMRANGVRSIAVSGWECHHEAVLSADRWPDHMAVPTFGPRMVCTTTALMPGRMGVHRDQWRPAGYDACRVRLAPAAYRRLRKRSAERWHA